MSTPFISIVIPVRNESNRLMTTMHSILENRSTKDLSLEIVIVDDASTDGCCNDLDYEASNLTVKVIRSDKHLGVPAARNLGAYNSASKILFMTDSHVQFSKNWDCYVLENLKENRILAATVADPDSVFKGYGCNLVVPFMGTHWNREVVKDVSPIQIAACPGTVLYSELFKKVGGYDSGMIRYGGAEPEFSIRAWLSGAEIVLVPQIEVQHRFKLKEERDLFLAEVRTFMVHNCLRFGLLYLNELASLQLIRYHTLKFPEHIQDALRIVERSDIWQRKTFLEKTLKYNLDWFVQKFNILDQSGEPILGGLEMASVNND